MILIDSSFWSTVGVISSNGNPNGNQYGFYNSIDMSNTVTIYNQYEFFKNSPINGVYYNNQYEWDKAIGVFHSEPIFDQYSFYQNVTFDGVNKVGNQYNFFKFLTAAISGDFLQGIFSTYNFTNMWSSENLTVSGTTTTLNDYSGEHDLTNPAAANQAIFNASGFGSNNKPYLAYNGIDDYNIKNTANWRPTDTTGVIDLAFRTGTDIATVQGIFATSDNATNNYKVACFITGGSFQLIIKNGGTALTSTFAITSSTDYVISIQQNATTLTVYVNGVLKATTLAGTLTYWFNDVPNRDNITFGAIIQGANFFFNNNGALLGYRPYISSASTLAGNIEISNYYGI